MLICIIFPVIGLIVNLFIYLYSRNINIKKRKIILLGIAFSMGILALNYYRIDNTGDVTKYLLQYKNLETSRFILDSYSKNYPLWYFIIYILKKYNINFQVLNFICVFFIYYINFFIVLKQNIDHKKEKQIILKILLYYSFAVLFSTYRGTLCFSLIMLGISYLINKQYKGLIFFIIAILLHPVSYIVITLYFFSLFTINNLSLSSKRIILVFSIFLGIINKKIIIFFSKNIFSKSIFYSKKINTYLMGYWSKYNFSDRGEVLSFLIIFIFFTFIVLYLLKSKNIKKNNEKYINFIFLYLIVTLNFIGFRTIFYRLSHDGFVFFLPLFNSYLSEKKNKKLYYGLLLILWYLILDYRNILYLFGFYKSTFYINCNIFYLLNI